MIDFTHQHDRRQFLKRSALVSLTPLVPTFLARSAAAADPLPDDRVLVIIQLDGGNDGLNTVIPFADELYSKYRREVKIDPQRIHKLDQDVGLHPQLKPAADLFESGRLAVVQGVGYPNPNRSHFESMAIWHHARLSADDHDGIGWLGRAGDAWANSGDATSASACVGADLPPVALRGRRSGTVTVESEADLALSPAITLTGTESKAPNDVQAFVQRSLTQSYATARRWTDLTSANAGGGDGYPNSKLSRNLRLISKMIKLGGGTRIFYATQSSYDTHAAQSFTHSTLLNELSAAVKAFLTDLAAAKLDDRVVVLMFSEFGRRVQENGSSGTDHGAAGPILLAGAPVRAGVLNRHPSLADLDAGDLKMQVDFRQIYATLLKNWLGVDSHPILGGDFEPFKCLRNQEG